MSEAQYDYTDVKKVKQYIHSAIQSNYVGLSNKSFDDFIETYKNDFDNSIDIMSHFLIKNVKDNRHKRYYDELKNFYDNHYGFDKIQETTVVYENSLLRHFGINRQHAMVYGIDDASLIHNVQFVISDDQSEPDWNSDDYWGWWDYSDGKFTMIYQNYKVFHVCFPYGVKEAEHSLQGKAYRLKILNIFQ